MSNRDISVQNDNPPAFSNLQYDSPVYFSGGVVSVDMVRIRLKFSSVDKSNELAEKAETWAVFDDYRDFVSRGQKLRPGTYRTLIAFGLGESSVSLGIGVVGSDCKPNHVEGFVEFNPNKVASDPRFDELISRISGYCVGASPVRWDLAFDLPIPRRSVRVFKDRRNYKCEISSAMTEYLGQRNRGGYVKVYDKAAESGLSCDLTRVELTCDAAWNVQKLLRQWPRVGVMVNPGNTSTLDGFALALADIAAAGNPIEPYLVGLSYRRKKKLVDAITDATLPMSVGPVLACMSRVLWWSGRFGGYRPI